jgi:hypothetical protein
MGLYAMTGEPFLTFLARAIAEDDPANGGHGLLVLLPIVTITTQAGATIAGELRPDGVVDIGQHCTHCGEDTGPGSGLFVNRVPSGADSYNAEGEPEGPEIDGYMCADCQCIECDKCGELTLEYSAAPHGRGFWCDDCAEGEPASVANGTGKANPEVTQ